jgi:hypothetical protein
VALGIDNALRISDAVKLLIVVEDIYEFPEGTLHFAPLVANPVLEGVKAGDPLELRRPDGTTMRTTLYGLDWPSPMCGKMGLSANKPLTKPDVPVGTEIWKVG